MLGVTVWAEKAATLVGIPRGRAWSAARKVVFGFADDGLASTANFVLSFLLARWLDPAEYGLFGLLYYSVAMGAVGFWGGAFLLPMSVLGPGRHSDRLGGYLTWLGRWQAWVSGGVFLAGIAVAVVLAILGHGGWFWAALGLGGALAGLTYMQFARRAAYVLRRPELAMVRSLVYVLVLAGGMALLARWKGVTAGGALLVMGAAGALAGWAASHGRGAATGSGQRAGVLDREVEAAEVAWELWSYGRWTMAQNALSWAVTGLPYFFSAGLLGLGSTGAFQAGMNFARPWVHVFTVFTLLTLPGLSSSFARRGVKGVRSVAVRWSVLLLAATTIYGAAVLLGGPMAYEVLYHGRYSPDLLLLAGLMLALVARAGTAVLMAALQAAEKPQFGVAAQAAAVLVGILAGPLAVRYGGVSGLGAWAAVQGWVQFGVALWAFRQVFSSPRLAVPGPGGESVGDLVAGREKGFDRQLTLGPGRTGR